MPRELRDSVVVITGASSGIGRAAAREFARQKATLVLAARREAALREVARACEDLGGRALVVPTDVTDHDAVESLARQAIENFGRIDVWVNNAAVTLFARVDEGPWENHRRVIETNLFGCLHGLRAVLPYLREQGSGTIINVSSVVAEAPQPYTSAYVCTKAAIRALSDCLRMELSLDGARGIHVGTILPASIDTPLLQQAANDTGRAVHPLPPVYSAEEVAQAIVEMAEDPQREVVVGRSGHAVLWGRRLAPGLYERTAARQVDRHHFAPAPAPPTAGNLFEPLPQYAGISGGWRPDDRSSTGRWALLGLAVALPALLWWTQRRDGRSAAGDVLSRTVRPRNRSPLSTGWG